MAKTPSKKSRPTDDLVKPLGQPLKESELDSVTGGKVVLSDFHFVKKSDKASPDF
jgi:type VI protein secretion system component Hcp